jgi:hypothetical protein
LFETFAVLSTLCCAVIFVALFQLDRAGRREEAEKREDGTIE